MTSTEYVWRGPILAAVITLLIGCASNGYDLSPVVPPGFELTGDWILESGTGDPIDAARRDVERSADHRDRQMGGRGAGMTPIGPPQIPVLAARSFVVEQSRDSMGIDYPGLPVRDVSWGRRKWSGKTIDAGWEEGVLIIRTRSDYYRLSEHYELSTDGQRLTLTVDFDPKRGDGIKARRVFVRHEIPGRAELPPTGPPV
jgi:hypothetical protein